MKTKSELTIRQNYFCFNLNPAIRESDPIMVEIRNLSRKYTSKAKMVLDPVFKRLKQTGAIWGVRAGHNLVPTVGRAVIAERIAGGTTYSGEVDYGAVGDGSTAFTNASTQLNNEIYRKQAASQAFSDNIAYIDWFIASADTPDDTFEEFGAFIDGTGAANSGQAFSLFITGGWVKSGSIFISAQYTIS